MKLALIDATTRRADNNGTPPGTAFYGLMSVKLAEAVYRSVETGGSSVFTK